MSMRPSMPSVILSRRMKIALSVAGGLIVLLILFVKFTGVYINYLWFGEVGTAASTPPCSGRGWCCSSSSALLMALIIGGNMVIAYLLRPPFRPMSAEQQNLERYVLMVEPRRRLILAVAMVIAFLAAGAGRAGQLAQLAAVAARRRLRRQGPAVPPRHLVLRVGLPGLPASCSASASPRSSSR